MMTLVGETLKVHHFKTSASGCAIWLGVHRQIRRGRTFLKVGRVAWGMVGEIFGKPNPKSWWMFLVVFCCLESFFRGYSPCFLVLFLFVFVC